MMSAVDRFLYGFVAFHHSKIFHGGNETTKKIAAKTGYPEWVIDQAYEAGWTDCMKAIRQERERCREQ
jgi:hypothetical protein